MRRSGEAPQFVIALPQQHGLEVLHVGETLQFEDIRNRARTLYVLERMSPTRVRVGLQRTAYLQEGILLRGEQGVEFTMGPVTPQPVDLRVQAGDRLLSVPRSRTARPPRPTRHARRHQLHTPGRAALRAARPPGLHR